MRGDDDDDGEADETLVRVRLRPWSAPKQQRRGQHRLMPRSRHGQVLPRHPDSLVPHLTTFSRLLHTSNSENTTNTTISQMTMTCSAVSTILIPSLAAVLPRSSSLIIDSATDVSRLCEEKTKTRKHAVYQTAHNAGVSTNVSADI